MLRVGFLKNTQTCQFACSILNRQGFSQVPQRLLELGEGSDRLGSSSLASGNGLGPLGDLDQGTVEFAVLILFYHNV